jgi:hypothetical protein
MRRRIAQVRKLRSLRRQLPAEKGVRRCIGLVIRD